MNEERADIERLRPTAPAPMVPDAGSAGTHQVAFWLLALVLLLAALVIFKDILLPFVAGMMVAYFLNPLVDRLVAAGLGRAMASALVVGVVGIAFVATLVLLVPLLVGQIEQLVKTLPTDIDRARKAMEAMAQQRLGGHFAVLQAALDRAVAEIVNNSTGLFTTAASVLWSRSAALINVLSLVLITPFVVFYLLVDWHPMMERIRLWLPRDHAGAIEGLANQINEAVAAFVRGQGAVCLCLGIFYALGLSLVGLNYGVVIGLMTGILTFIPMVGSVVGLATAIIVAIIQFAPNIMPIAAVVGVMVSGMFIDTAVLAPKFVGKKVGLHPVWLIFALFAFSYLFGFVGTMVAVPVSAAIAVLCRFGIARYLESDVYRGRRGPGSATVTEPAS